MVAALRFEYRTNHTMLSLDFGFARRKNVLSGAPCSKIARSEPVYPVNWIESSHSSEFLTLMADLLSSEKPNQWLACG